MEDRLVNLIKERARSKYFHVYRDGVQIWPIGIICIRRILGFGFGISKERGSDVIIGIGILFTVHLIKINWKILRSRKSAGTHNNCFTLTKAG